MPLTNVFQFQRKKNNCFDYYDILYRPSWLQYIYMITEFRLSYPICDPVIRSLLCSYPVMNFNKFQMLMNVRRTTMTAAHWPLVTTYLTVTIAPACQVTPVMDSTVQVSLVTAMNLAHCCWSILQCLLLTLYATAFEKRFGTANVFEVS